MPVRIKWYRPTSSGRRTGWARTVGSIDKSQRGARGLVGSYLQNGVETDLPLGQVVVQVSPRGSVKNGWEAAEILRVTKEGLEPVDEAQVFDWWKDRLSFLDALQEELDKNETTEEDTSDVDLSEVPTDDLVAELKRRGVL